MKKLIFIVFSTILTGTGALAEVISVTGNILQIAAPANVAVNSGLESNSVAYLFAERKNETLATPIGVNATTTGLFDTFASLTPGSISAGTKIDSYYYHADPVGALMQFYFYGGSITFDSVILGIVGLSAELASTNFLGAPSTAYSSANSPFEMAPYDGFTISADRRTITIYNAANSAADDLRIITAAAVTPISEPETCTMLLAGLGLMGGVAHRRKLKQSCLT